MVDETASNILELRGAYQQKQHEQQQEQQQRKPNFLTASPVPSTASPLVVPPSPVPRSVNPAAVVARVVTRESLRPEGPSSSSSDRCVPFADPSVVEFSAPEGAFATADPNPFEKFETFESPDLVKTANEDAAAADDDAFFESLSSHCFSDENDDPLLASVGLSLGIGFADQADRISDSSASSSPVPVDGSDFDCSVHYGDSDIHCINNNSSNSDINNSSNNCNQYNCNKIINDEISGNQTVPADSKSNRVHCPVKSDNFQTKAPAQAQPNKVSSDYDSHTAMADSSDSTLRPSLVPTPLLPSPESSPAPASAAAVPPIAPVAAAATSAPSTAAPPSSTAPSTATAYPLPNPHPPVAAKPLPQSQPPPNALAQRPHPHHAALLPPPPSALTHYHPHAHHLPPRGATSSSIPLGLPPISIPAAAPSGHGEAGAATSTPRPNPSNSNKQTHGNHTPNNSNSSNNYANIHGNNYPLNNNNNNNNNNNMDSPNSNSNNSGVAENTGRWTAEEHRLFLQGLEQHGKGWKKIAGLIKSRTVVQIRTHAQKYFQKLAKARQNGEGVPGAPPPHAGATLPHLAADGVPPPIALAGATDGYGAASAADASGTQGSMGATAFPAPSRASAGHAGTGPMALAGRPRVAAGGTTGNMSMGTDPTSLAVAAAGLSAITGTTNAAMASGAAAAGAKRRRAVPAGTKRRAIGSVVRSAVREGRNIKRQKIAEAKRNAGSGGEAAAERIANPLPAISDILGPFVATTAMARPHGAAPLSAVASSSSGRGGGKNAENKGNNARGRNQLVQTATHGTLPMASLEDAVFRLLTPATGAPAPQLPPGSTSVSPSIMDPLAPNQVRPHNLTHTNYGVPNSSPTCVADISTYPSWVDINNPPQWYNDGSDIDKLLEDADCLNWLDDTGDFEENYMSPTSDMDLNIDPTSVTSDVDRTQHNEAVSAPEDDQIKPMSSYVETPSLLSTDGTATDMERTAIKMEDVSVEPAMIHAGGVVHPSGESLSFLVDENDEVNTQGFVQNTEESLHNNTSANMAVPYSSATEAVDAHDHDSSLYRDESHAGLMGFPDLGMGDDQAFVSALLDDNGQNSIISFPKFHSDLGVHLSHGQSEMGLSKSSEAHLKEEVP